VYLYNVNIVSFVVYQKQPSTYVFKSQNNTEIPYVCLQLLLTGIQLQFYKYNYYLYLHYGLFHL